MEAYAETIVEIPTFRKEVGSTSLNGAEMSVYRGYIRKLMWLTRNVRLDLNFSVLELSKKMKEATLKDLKSINPIVVRI